jgi:uncharacterized protein
MNEQATGESNLNLLIQSMKPQLEDGEYVFCTINRSDFQEGNFDAKCIFHEREGTTLIVNKRIAEQKNLSYTGTWSLITCSVHSDLSAVGFLAAMSQKLAQAKISVNVVSAYFHDHLFVPKEDAPKAIEILKDLSDTT